MILLLWAIAQSWSRSVHNCVLCCVCVCVCVSLQPTTCNNSAPWLCRAARVPGRPSELVDAAAEKTSCWQSPAGVSDRLSAFAVQVSVATYSMSAARISLSQGFSLWCQFPTRLFGIHVFLDRRYCNRFPAVLAAFCRGSISWETAVGRRFVVYSLASMFQEALIHSYV